MVNGLKLLFYFFVALFKSRRGLALENVVLRHQLNVLRRRMPSRPRLSALDRLILVWLYRLRPSLLGAVRIVRPETVVRWHRAGFRRYWRWKSRSRGGRPQTSAETRGLIREMSLTNPLWGAPRIHGELLKLGIEVAQLTVAKYMVKAPRRPSQSWKTFLRNHAGAVAAMDLLVVPTVNFRLLYAQVILRHHRRHILALGVTRHPTAEWIARQITDAFAWTDVPGYMVRDRDAIYGDAVVRRLRAMGIRDRPTAPQSPWQNGHAEMARSDVNISITSWSSEKLIFAESSRPIRPTTTPRGLISRLTRTHRFTDPFTASDGSPRSKFSVGFTISTPGSNFR